MFVATFGITNGDALTLRPEEVNGDSPTSTGESTRTHADGWTISGEVVEDYFYWVNEFIAHHPEHGKVWGDFEKQVYADSAGSFIDFYTKHTPEHWDYYDI